MVSRDIALHNQKEGSNELMIVTNPNCKNCASVHRHMVEIASSVPVSLVLVTFPMIGWVRKLPRLLLRLITLSVGIGQ